LPAGSWSTSAAPVLTGDLPRVGDGRLPRIHWRRPGLQVRLDLPDSSSRCSDDPALIQTGCRYIISIIAALFRQQS
jgi:hypothetical protein